MHPSLSYSIVENFSKKVNAFSPPVILLKVCAKKENIKDTKKMKFL